MKCFEYKFFNMSEVEAAKNRVTTDEEKAAISRITVLNEHGAEGWEVVIPLSPNVYLMKREYNGAVNQFYVGSKRRV